MNTMSSALRQYLPDAFVPDAMLYPAPNRKWFVDIADHYVSRYTPDQCVLDEYQFQLVFVYGTTMTGMPSQGFMGDGSTLLAKSFTKWDWRMFSHKDGRGSYPVVIYPNEGDQRTEAYEEGKTIYRGPAMVRGELYKVRPQQFSVLDRYMANGVLFQRQRVRVIIPSNRLLISTKHIAEDLDSHEVSLFKTYNEVQELCEVRAWMYIGTEYWNDRVASEFIGRKPPPYLIPPATIYKPRNPNLRPYYCFNRLDLSVK